MVNNSNFAGETLASIEKKKVKNIIYLLLLLINGQNDNFMWFENSLFLK